MKKVPLRTVAFILLILSFSIWIDLPNNPGIHIGNYKRSISTKLGLDLQGGVQALLEADTPPDIKLDADIMRTAKVIVDNRVNGLGVTEALVQLAGDRRIVVEIPGVQDSEDAIATIRETGMLEFVHLGSVALPEGTKIKTNFAETLLAPDGSNNSPTETPTDNQTNPEDTIYETVMTGAELKSVNVDVDQAGNFLVSFQLTDKGARVFSDYTGKNIGNILAIVLDGEIISNPQVKNQIKDGNGVIQGNFTRESANKLAIQLRYGSLPIPLKVIESKTVGPTLGQDSLRKSMVAGIIGISVVLLFMGLYYRLLGILANIALICYALITFALFRFIPVTLTLPGIAGFVLSIGVAVDANILIFERLKEELRRGRKLVQAIDLGWDRAWPSIRDSNLSTLITCGILFWFGSTFGASIVKGFSLTLAIGVVVSLFTAITVTRTLLHIVLDRIDLADHPTWFGV